ncbi:MAG: DUF3515 domain-containing protein, partial [Nocardioides sp.]|nr:DUF3515 domain-containing protein [Nocardioides sp.]
PQLVLRCGVGNPDGFDPAAVPDPDDPPPCTIVSGVGWYVPLEQARGGETATFTAIGYRPRVSVTVQPEDQPEGGAAALAELAQVVKDQLARQALDPAVAGPEPSPCA